MSHGYTRNQSQRRWTPRGEAAALLVTLSCVLAPSASRAETRVDGEVALEQRLVAPCCWVQTLDVHDSPLAKDLRAEIHSRLVKGESPASIETDLVGRFGKRIVAMPPSNPLVKIAAAVSAMTLLVGVVVYRALRRWQHAGAAALASGKGSPDAPVGAQTARRDEWDERLDEELKDS